MALTKTTLAAACGAEDLRLRVTSSAGATVGCIVQIGDEFAYCTSIDTATQITVRSRGSNGGRAKAHTILAPVTFGLGSDYIDQGQGRSDVDIREAAVDQDFDPGVSGGKNLTRHTEVLIVKAGAWAQTITAPSQSQDGLNVRFVAVAHAGPHLITFAAGFYASAGSSDIATLTGIGSSLTIRAQNGAWGVVSLAGAAIA